MKNIRVFTRSVLIASTFVICFSHILNAQPTLYFNRVSIQNWPQVSLFLNVKCGSDPRNDLTKSNFKIVENGVEITNFSLICPDPQRHCCISTVLVIDRSTKMGEGSPSGLDNAKAGAKGFVDAMDGICDEASVMSFSSRTSVDVFMTTDKLFLQKGIDSLKVSQGELVWDAAYAAIEELANSGTQECRGVIIFTTGNDYGSCRTIDDIISLALFNKVHVFVIGLGSNINDADLSRIGADTGGKYYKLPQPSQLVAVYKEITTIIGGFYECEIQYTTVVSDTSKRIIELTLQKLFGCPGTDTKIKIIPTPLDTTVYPLSIHLDSLKVVGNGKVKIPMTLATSFSDTLKQSSFSILFDTSLVHFDHLETSQYLLEFIPNSIDKLSNGIRIRLQKEFYLYGSGTLGLLWFTVSDPLNDTTCILRLADWTSQSTRYKPVLYDGAIEIIPTKPQITCREFQSEIILKWDSLQNKYSPNPFAATFQFGNCGTGSAKSAIATISFDTTKLSLDNPKTYSQQCTPHFIDPQRISIARWQLLAKPSARDVSVLITCTASFDNYSSVACSTIVFIPKSPLVDVIELSSPSSFYLGQNYPNPFTQMTSVQLPLLLGEGWVEDSRGEVMSRRGEVVFKIYDLFGREILDLSEKLIDNTKLIIDNSQLPSQGIYFYRLTIGNQSQTKMMTFIK